MKKNRGITPNAGSPTAQGIMSKDLTIKKHFQVFLKVRRKIGNRSHKMYFQVPLLSAHYFDKYPHKEIFSTRRINTLSKTKDQVCSSGETILFLFGKNKWTKDIVKKLEIPSRGFELCIMECKTLQ